MNDIEERGKTSSKRDRYIVLAAAALGWFLAGPQLGLTSLAMRSAAVDLLGTTEKAIVGAWFSYYVCAFLLGAAAGGLVFGWIGDRIGRTKALALAIVTYSVLSGLTYFVKTPEQLLLFRFLTCMGVGGTWPNGVALVSEAWANLSRPMVAGIIGTAVNVGIFGMGALASIYEISPEQWRWILLVGAAPVFVGVLVPFVVPESPTWLASRSGGSAEAAKPASISEVFRPPLLKLTVIGILLGAVPLIGGWGSANWVMPWADQVGEEMDPPDPFLKGRLQMSRSITGIVGSVLGGVMASYFGRRKTYFALSLIALAASQLLFRAMDPATTQFLIMFGVLGFFSGAFFGWLPFCLPELFPTRVRSTGVGVSFNWGRILSVVAVLTSGTLVAATGGFAELGRVTSFIYLVGMVVILFAPDTSKVNMED